MKNRIITLIFLFCFGALSAQVSLEPKTIPSPNTASLGIYGAIPVGHYTGIPDINIPLYEIELDRMTLPISLNYHASGIKVAQEASWVGMGWSLNAGGCITRSVQGWDDFGNGPIAYWSDYRPPLYTEHPFAHSDMGSTEYYKYVDAAANRLDTEPDIFYFNFGGKSGKFFVQRKIESQSDIPTATVQTPNCYLEMKYDFNKWITTDGNGFKYYFGTQEVSSGRSLSRKNEPNPYSYYSEIKKTAVHIRDTQPHIIDGWYLDSIVSPNRQKIEFTYGVEHIYTPLNMQETVYEPTYGVTGPRASFTTYSFSENKIAVLKKITTNNLVIDFTGETRHDIEPKYPYPKPTRLSEISIKNDQSLIKKYKFDYFYMGTPDNYDNCRLFLNGVQEVGTNENNGGSYTMGYYSGTLPSKASTEIDHWGIIPSPTLHWFPECGQRPLKKIGDITR